MACHSGLYVISFSSIRCDALSFCRSALPCVTASMWAQGILIASVVCTSPILCAVWPIECTGPND